jgi:hypothetical protein
VRVAYLAAKPTHQLRISIHLLAETLRAASDNPCLPRLPRRASGRRTTQTTTSGLTLTNNCSIMNLTRRLTRKSRTTTSKGVARSSQSTSLQH